MRTAPMRKGHSIAHVARGTQAMESSVQVRPDLGVIDVKLCPFKKVEKQKSSNWFQIGVNFLDI